MASTTKTFRLTISVDSDIADKYPNFQWNWETPEEFVEHLVEHIESDGVDEYGRNAFGYRVAVTEL
jgi:hypothetical protein